MQQQLQLNFNKPITKPTQVEQLDLVVEYNKNYLKELTKDLPVFVEIRQKSILYEPDFRVYFKRTGRAASCYGLDEKELKVILNTVTLLYKQDLIDFNKTVTLRNIIRYIQNSLISYFLGSPKLINALLNRPYEYILGYIEHQQNRLDETYCLHRMLLNKQTRRQAEEIIMVLAFESHKYLLDVIKNDRSPIRFFYRKPERNFRERKARRIYLRKLRLLTQLK